MLLLSFVAFVSVRKRRKDDRLELVRREAAHQEAAHQEAARREAARQEAARQEAERREAARQEAARREAARREGEKKREKVLSFKSLLTAAWDICLNILSEEEAQGLADIKALQAEKMAELNIDLLRRYGLVPSSIDRLRADGVLNVWDVAQNLERITDYPGIGSGRQDEIKKRVVFLEKRSLEDTCLDLSNIVGTIQMSGFLALANFKTDCEKASLQCEDLLKSTDRYTSDWYDSWSWVSVKDEILDKWPELIEICDNIVSSTGEINPDIDIRLKDRARIIDLLVSYSGVESWETQINTEIISSIDSIDLLTEHFIGELRPYQNFGARFAISQKYTILGDEMGLGKTAQAIGVATHLKSFLKKRLSVLVVVPASLIENWLHEFQGFTEFPVASLRGAGLEKKCKAFVQNGEIGIISYSTLSRNIRYNFRGGRHTSDLFDSHRFDLLIIDEAHYIGISGLSNFS